MPIETDDLRCPKCRDLKALADRRMWSESDVAERNRQLTALAINLQEQLLKLREKLNAYEGVEEPSPWAAKELANDPE